MPRSPGLSETEPEKIELKNCRKLNLKKWNLKIVKIHSFITITIMTITNLCFQGLVTANSPGAVATPVSGSLVAFVAFSLVMMLTVMVNHIYGDIDFGADEDADTGDGDSGSDKCTFAEPRTFSFLQEQI